MSGQLTLAETFHEEQLVSFADPRSSEKGDSEANNRKGVTFEDGTLSSLLDHGWKEELEFNYNCSALFLNKRPPRLEELLKDEGKPERNSSTSAEPSPAGEHVDKILTPLPEQRCWQQKVVSPHLSPKEFQHQQEESLAQLSQSASTKPLSEASCSTRKPKRLPFKCRFCSAGYKYSARLKKHVYSAHKDKKIHKSCFCKRSFFFPGNLKNHLEFHKEMTRWQKARKNRINARKVRQRIWEERKLEPTKKKQSKYEQFFTRIDRDFAPLGVPAGFSCQSCFFASSSPRIFIHHMKGHKERPPCECPLCDYSYISVRALLNHLYWHAGYQLYLCRFCNVFSIHFASMVRHSSIHTGAEPYFCEFCHSAFASTTGLQRHGRLHMGKEACQGQQQLDFVREGRRAPRALTKYTKSVRPVLGLEVGGIERSKACDLPSQPRLHQCAECVYATSRSSNLQLHVRIHTGEKPYSCSLCQRRFRTSSHLKRHGLVHADAAPFRCRNCDYSTNKWLFLKQHLASRSCGESSSSVCQQNQPPVQTYTCEECGYSTACNGNLKLHLRIHMGEKPFRCGQCATAFRTSSHLKWHLLTYSKLHCRRCKFSTVGKGAFQKHVKTHRQQYRCGRCNALLPTEKVVERHERQHQLGM